MNKTIKIAAAVAAIGMASQAFAQITFYEGDGLRGRAPSPPTLRDLSRNGFNDRASSAVVDRGQWEVCEDANFRGQCMVLRRGSYESLGGMGLNNRISSVRPVKRATVTTMKRRHRWRSRATSGAAARANVSCKCRSLGACGRRAGAALLGRAPASQRAIPP
jgi:hypothetical protein